MSICPYISNPLYYTGLEHFKSHYDIMLGHYDCFGVKLHTSSRIIRVQSAFKPINLSSHTGNILATTPMLSTAFKKLHLEIFLLLSFSGECYIAGDSPLLGASSFSSSYTCNCCHSEHLQSPIQVKIPTGYIYIYICKNVPKAISIYTEHTNSGIHYEYIYIYTYIVYT